MAKIALKLLLVSCGLVSLTLGIIGAFLPILPTTPLVLLAAFFFARSSPWLHGKMLNNRLMGPAIRDWQAHGAINRRAKYSATGMMALLVGYTLIYVALPLWIKVILGVVCGSVLVFIWSRPARPLEKAVEIAEDAVVAAASETP